MSLVIKLLQKVIDSTTLEAAKAYADAGLLALDAQDKVRVFLESFAPGQLVPVVKELRNQLGLGLKEAKDLCDTAPALIATTSFEAGNQLKKVIEGVGGKVTLR